MGGAAECSVYLQKRETDYQIASSRNQFAKYCAGPCNFRSPADGLFSAEATDSPGVFAIIAASLTSTLENVKSLGVPFTLQGRIVRALQQIVVAVRVLEHMTDSHGAVSPLLPVFCVSRP